MAIITPIDRFRRLTVARNFTTSGSYVSFDNAPWASGSPWTVLAWVRPTTAFGSQQRICNQLFGGSIAQGIYIENTGGISAENTGTFIVPTAYGDLNTWTSIVIGTDSAGTFGITSKVAYNTNANNGSVVNGSPYKFIIGYYVPGGIQPFQGDIAMVACWDKKLSRVEATSLTQGARPQKIARGNLKLLWTPRSAGTADFNLIDNRAGTVFGVPTLASAAAAPLLP